jgi:hypothetical protein
MSVESQAIARRDGWRRAVLREEGLADWRIKFAADGYCWLESKVIQIPENASPALFLHEVAHALAPEPENTKQDQSGGWHYHGRRWGDAFGMLVDKYMMVPDG